MTALVDRTAKRATSLQKKQSRKTSAGGVAKVDTTTANSKSELALPHERDEKVGMTGGVQSGRVQQAARDVDRGLQDTSGAVETNDTYKKLKR